jgi:hypothetical protein
MLIELLENREFERERETERIGSSVSGIVLMDLMKQICANNRTDGQL